METPIRTCFCTPEYFPKLTRFIDEHWRKNHRMARDFDLMKWQHYDLANDRWNFVLGLKEDEIIGILGFIDSRRFEREIHDRSLLWLAIWKVREDIRVPGLGLALRSFLTREYKADGIGTLGINNTVLPLYKNFGYKTGTLDHFYFVNRHVKDFRIAKNVKISTEGEGGKTLFSLDEKSIPAFLERVELSKEIFPAKSLSYLQNRYARHPVYKYEFLGLVNEVENPSGIFVTRTQVCEDRKVLRIVDFVGSVSELKGMGSCFETLLMERDLEYVDLLCFGVEEEGLLKSGFQKLKHEGETIIPNYFEPFLRENIPIQFAYKYGAKERPLFFKGDGDQDRPN